MSRYIEMTAGLAPPAALVGAVHRETEGNPFFLGEIVRSCQEEGLQYWQHVIALTPELMPGAASGAAAQASSEGKRSTDGRRAVRLIEGLYASAASGGSSRSGSSHPRGPS